MEVNSGVPGSQNDFNTPWIGRIPEELLPDYNGEKTDACEVTKTELGDLYYNIQSSEECIDESETLPIKGLENRLSASGFTKIEGNGDSKIFRLGSTIYQKNTLYVGFLLGVGDGLYMDEIIVYDSSRPDDVKYFNVDAFITKLKFDSWENIKDFPEFINE